MLASLVSLALVSTASAHTLFQRLSVNGVDQGQAVGIRVPRSNYPILDLASNDLICNKNYTSPVSDKVIDVEAGATLGAFWGHILGGMLRSVFFGLDVC
jgi:lytic cellulose monooxygenase (C1-hydroxylating)